MTVKWIIGENLIGAICIAENRQHAPEKKLGFTFAQKLGIWRAVRTRFFKPERSIAICRLRLML